jgi:hypothetical protein
VGIDTGYQGTGNDCEGAMGHARKAVEEARAFKEAVSESANNFTQAINLRGRVDKHPIAMVLAAVGVGYVLGGGLFSPLTGRLLSVGLRLAVIPLVKSQLAAMAGAAVQPDEGTAGSPF